jgi:CubicO group peptidase (beta-lactamase class C family)
MHKPKHLLFYIPVLLILLLSTQCGKEDVLPIVPNTGYNWPSTNRSYWPTDGWIAAPLVEHGINPAKMNRADQFAKNDNLAKALLVVKDGYLVFEKYYHGGDAEQSSNLWSVTKSVSSALVGIIKDDREVSSTNQFMTDFLPQYPDFKKITLHHALTHTTGLDWDEEGPRWVEWIFSDDWVQSALDRGFNYPPGRRWKYSSGNSHFLTSLVYYHTGETPGALAKERLFEPMGIDFDTLSEPITYTNWDQYKEPLIQTWRQDPKGIECASFGLYLTARDMAKFGYLYLNRGRWDNGQLISESWVLDSTKEHETDIYGRYSYGYQWYITLVDGHPAFLASGFGGQIIGVVPSLDLVVVLKYEAEDPVHPDPGTGHDDMGLFDLVVQAVN